MNFYEVTMKSLMIVYFIVTTLSEGLAIGANDTIIVSEEGNDIKIVAEVANASQVKIETDGDKVLKIVVNDDDEYQYDDDEMYINSDDEFPKRNIYSPQRETASPPTYQKVMWRADIFQNHGHPKPQDVPILNRKIFKGARVTIREHPYVVSIRRLYSHYLPGSLISGNLVLTVAHPVHRMATKPCSKALTVAHPVHRVSTAELGVVAGENYSDRGTSINSVIFVVIHQDFDPYVLANDIAILRTYDEFFHSTNLKAIKFHVASLPLGAQAFVTGWGRCDFTGKELCLPRSNIYYPREVLDPMLRTVSFTITNNSYCQHYTRNEVPLRPGMMCMGISRLEEYMASCLGVPGAPQVVNGRLAGILSWGIGCGYTFDMPLVYVNVSYYKTWLFHNLDILGNIHKQEISIFDMATRAHVMQQWVNRTRNLLQDTGGDEHDLQTFEVDLELANIVGTIYDIRDFLYNQKYHKQKHKLYDKIRAAQKKILLVNYSYTMLPFLNKQRFQKLGIHIRDDGTLSEDDYY